MVWTPHATVATIVEKNDSLLMVEEISNGQRVFNQPAGHVEEGESVFDAAIRETREETGWAVELTSFLGHYIYRSPHNGVTYYRICFVAKTLEQVSTQLDPDIVAAHWLNPEEIEALGTKLRSPLVSKCVQDYYSREALPLDYIREYLD